MFCKLLLCVRFPVRVSCIGGVALPELICGGRRQFIASFIFRMPVVASHPVKCHLVLAAGGQKTLPQVPIFHRFS